MPPVLLSKLHEGYVMQNQTVFCHNKQHGFTRSDGKCYSYLRWHHWMCEVTHGAKWFGTQFWCRTTYIPRLLGVEHKLCSLIPLCSRGMCGLSDGQLSEGLFKVEGRGIKQDLIQDVRRLELTNVRIEGRIIGPDIHDLLDGPFEVICLPTHYGEVVHTNVVSYNFNMVIDVAGGPKVFPKLFPKGPFRFHHLLLITIQFVTCVPVGYSVFLCAVIPVLGATRSFLVVFSPSKWTHTPTLLQMYVKPLLNPLVYGTTLLVVMVAVVVGELVLVVVFGLGGSVSMVAVDLESV